jgi:hypothetical protein
MNLSLVSDESESGFGLLKLFPGCLVSSLFKLEGLLCGTVRSDPHYQHRTQRSYAGKEEDERRLSFRSLLLCLCYTNGILQGLVHLEESFMVVRQGTVGCREGFERAEVFLRIR